MTVKVRLLPSGHEFPVEPGENLLEAALRAGLSIRYSCNSGSCGECRARLVSGELGDTLHHDYPLNERERADDQFLMCRASAASDLVIEAVEARGAEDVPVQTLTTQVSKLVRLSEDVMELQLRTPRSQTLWFLAGQHVRLSIPGIAPRHKSIASCPCNGMVLQFHVRRRPGDPFSDHVFTRMKVRDAVGIEGPFGNFVLDEESDRPLIFVAFETGFAPVKSLIEHAISLEMRQPMRLYWITGSARGHYLENHCRAWQGALDDFEFVPIGGSDHSGEMETGAELAVERAVDQLLTDHPDLSDSDVYANGPEVLFAGLSAVLLARGLPPDRLFVDQVQRF
jgi:CDP-4-dehydro-6-deoxyglucose reductase